MSTAEFLGLKKLATLDGFAAMGKPIPLHRKEAAYTHCKAMGVTGEEAWTVIGRVSDQLARDKPYEAMRESMRYLDLTGTYRLFAVLLAAEDKGEQQ